MPYLIVRREPIVIVDEMTIPCPLSHAIDSKSEALQFLIARKRLADEWQNAYVMPEARFRALSGLAPRRG